MGTWKNWIKNKYQEMTCDTAAALTLTDKLQVQQSASGPALETTYQSIINRGVKADTTTAYAFLAEDHGKVLTLTNGSGITATFPNTLPAGWRCRLVQLGAGQVTVAAASGGTLRTTGGKNKITGQYSVAELTVLTNADGASAVAVLSGDVAT